MSKEIEEMARVMCQDAGTKNCNIDCNAHPICDVYFYAERLYKEGYRKESEGEWQTAPDGTHWCSECGHDATYTFDGTEICGVACPFCGAKMKGDHHG